jgi:hypothetical protein
MPAARGVFAERGASSIRGQYECFEKITAMFIASFVLQKTES